MKYRTLSLRVALPGLLFTLALLVLPAHAQDDSTTDELEAFIAEETAIESSESISPLSRPVSSVFGSDRDLIEVPRAVTVLTPETIKQFDVRSFEDLSRVSAGTQRPNIFGLPGSPHIRGDLAGVYFNGMLRIFNRNERPTGFGSLESMDIVKGPAPANLAPTDVGGYAWFVPKSPFFDEFRGQFKLTVGSHQHYNTQIDLGGPQLIFDTPAAYRLSITGQLSESYYDAVDNDYISIYGAVKARLSENLRLYTGAEYFNFKTNENAGWNRLTQDLIDRSEYIVGTMDPNTTSQLFGGNANLFSTYDFGTHQLAAATGTYFPDNAITVPVAMFNELFPFSGQEAVSRGMIEVFDPATGDLYGYKYTPEYFESFGDAEPFIATTTIEGSTVLSDPSDFSESDNFLWFADFEYILNDNMTLFAKSFFEYVKAEKLSSYGFANFNETWKLEERVEIVHTIEDNLTLTYGLNVNYTDSEWHVDFFAEPFNRRDISLGFITPQSIVTAGPQNDINNDGEWDLDAGDTSEILQAGIYVQADWRPTEKFLLIGGLRGEYADFSGTNIFNFLSQDPETGELDFLVSAAPFSGDNTHFVANINPTFMVTENISLYAGAQVGSIFVPNQVGGLDQGEFHFQEAELFEVGAKANLMDGKLYASIAAYTWEKTELNSNVAGDFQNNFEAEGIELELFANPIEGLKIMSTFTALEVKAVGAVPFGTRPLTPEQTTLHAGAIQYDVVTPDDVRYANNPERKKPGFPEISASIFAIYEMPNGFGFGIGPEYKSSFYGDWERTLTYDSALVWNANLFYKRENWEVFLRISNLTDEDYFIGNDGSFGDNTITTKATPMQAYLTVTTRF